MNWLPGRINLYPLPTPGIAAGTGFNFSNVPVRKLDEGNSTSVWIQFLQQGHGFFSLQLRSSHQFRPRGSPGFAEPSAFASTGTSTTRMWRVETAFSDAPSTKSAAASTVFSITFCLRHRSRESARLVFRGQLDSSSGRSAGLRNRRLTACCGWATTRTPWGLGDRGFQYLQAELPFPIADSLDMIRGKHDIKVGGQVRAQQMNELTNAFQDGFLIPFGVSGDASADLLMGTIGLGIHDQTFLGATTGRRWKMFRPYAQDDWR
jgi:hypothetical protein